VRVTVELDGWTVEPAVEYRAGDDFATAAAVLSGAVIAVHAMARIESRMVEVGQMELAERIGAQMARLWPDRAYFVEVWQHGAEGFAQVFQPFGVPRNAIAGPL
jgi:hypothetical protein